MVYLKLQFCTSGRSTVIQTKNRMAIEQYKTSVFSFCMISRVLCLEWLKLDFFQALKFHCSESAKCIVPLWFVSDQLLLVLEFCFMYYHNFIVHYSPSRNTDLSQKPFESQYTHHIIWLIQRLGTAKSPLSCLLSLCFKRDIQKLWAVLYIVLIEMKEQNDVRVTLLPFKNFSFE